MIKSENKLIAFSIDSCISPWPVRYTHTVTHIHIAPTMQMQMQTQIRNQSPNRHISFTTNTLNLKLPAINLPLRFGFYYFEPSIYQEQNEYNHRSQTKQLNSFSFKIPLSNHLNQTIKQIYPFFFMFYGEQRLKPTK